MVASLSEQAQHELGLTPQDLDPSWSCMHLAPVMRRASIEVKPFLRLDRSARIDALALALRDTLDEAQLVSLTRPYVARADELLEQLAERDRHAEECWLRLLRSNELGDDADGIAKRAQAATVRRTTMRAYPSWSGCVRAAPRRADGCSASGSPARSTRWAAELYGTVVCASAHRFT